MELSFDTFAADLTCRGETRPLFPGHEFELDAGEPHAERYGEAGATYWVGRRG